MSQHDLNIANQGFPAFRADLNDALVALGSTNSGATAPATTYANQLWYDTANNILKIRNEDNDAWISLLTLNQTADTVSEIATAIAILGAGSASNPSLTTAGDANTGIFFPAADTIAFAEGGVEVMRINATGSLLVGIASNPSDLFKIVAAGTDNNNLIGSYNTASGNAGIRIQANQAGLYLQGSGTVDPLFITNSSGSGYISFRPASDTERMRILSNGKVAIGSSGTGNGVALSVDGSSASDALMNFRDTRGDGASGVPMCYFQRTSGTVGSINTTTSSTSYNTSSDYRLKENIAPMTGALNLVQQLKPVTYKWKSSGKESQGFIAHELQDIVPDCVTGEKDGMRIERYEITPAIPATYDEEGNELTPAVEAVIGEREVPDYQGIDTSFLVATLTAAIQELKAEVDFLKTQINKAA